MTIRLPLAALLCACMALAACGGGDDEDEGPQRACSSKIPDSSVWDLDGISAGTNRIGELPSAPIEEFNRILEAADPPLSTSPCDAARVFLHLDQLQVERDVEYQVRAIPPESPDADVEVTMTNLGDDSILAERWTFIFEAGEGDSVRLFSALRTQSCNPGRGHADFTPKPCV